MRFRNNFGAIRYILAFAIFLSHYNILTQSNFWFPITGYYRVCSFFVMSGFLIYGSFQRSNDWKDYLKNRAWRILPSYLLTVVACAFLLVFVSELPPADYFLSLQWIKYLIANALSLNFIEPQLPGVFPDHVEPAVNASLWTMKVEWMLYLFIIPVIWFSHKSKWPFWKVFLVILGFSVVYRWFLLHMAETSGRESFRTLDKQIWGQLGFFYSGVFLYVYLEKVKKVKYALAIVSFAVLFVGVTWFGGHMLFRLLFFPTSLAGLVVSLAFIGQWGKWAEMFENCSYEIYLFHFPMIHVAVHLGLPDTLGKGLTFCLIFCLTAALAYVTAKYFSAPIRRAHRSAKRIAMSDEPVAVTKPEA
ncbi:MAG: acyltransferase [Bacteroidales bacterium]|nr:acyltransferase [Bacteroidales bacterium]